MNLLISVTIPRLILLRRNVSDRSCTENKNTHFMFNNFVRRSHSLEDNVEEYGRARQATDDNIIRRMARWISKATNTHSEYVILIAFPRNYSHAKERQCYICAHITYFVTSIARSPKVALVQPIRIQQRHSSLCSITFFTNI